MLWLLWGLLLVGCVTSTQEAPPETAEETVLTDIPTLTKGMDIAAQPVEAQWVESRLGNSTVDIGPSDFVLLAVMRFDEAGLAAVQGQLTDPQEGITVDPAILRDWFPEEVRAAFTPDATGEFLTVKVPIYTATPFFTGSYQQGYAFIVGNTIFLRMQTT